MNEAADLLEQLKEKVELAEQNSTQMSQYLGDMRQAANALQLSVLSLDEGFQAFHQKVCARVLCTYSFMLRHIPVRKIVLGPYSRCITRASICLKRLHMS